MHAHTHSLKLSNQETLAYGLSSNYSLFTHQNTSLMFWYD